MPHCQDQHQFDVLAVADNVTTVAERDRPIPKGGLHPLDWTTDGRMRDKQRTTSLKLDPELRGRVQRLADARRRSPHWVMREAIAEYVVRAERREQFRADAGAA